MPRHLRKRPRHRTALSAVTATAAAVLVVGLPTSPVRAEGCSLSGSAFVDVDRSGTRDPGLASSGVTSTSITYNGIQYDGFQALTDEDFVSWLDSGDKVLSHEYGHAWSLYRAYLLQQDPSMQGYLQARGLAGDPRVNSTYPRHRRPRPRPR